VTLTEAMATSKLYIALVTHNFVEDVRNGDTRIIREIETAKSFNLDCILFLFDNLTEDDRKFAEKLFRNHRVIQRYENVSYETEKFREWCARILPELKAKFEKILRRKNSG